MVFARLKVSRVVRQKFRGAGLAKGKFYAVLGINGSLAPLITVFKRLSEHQTLTSFRLFPVIILSHRIGAAQKFWFKVGVRE